MSYLIRNRMIVPFLFISFFVFVVNTNAQPTPERSDITIRSLANVGSATVRIKYDSVTKLMYILQDDGVIKRVDLNNNGTATLITLYTTADHGLSKPLGMTFGKDGTMYLVGIEVTDTNSSYGVGRVVKGIPDTIGSENRTWSTLAKTVPYTWGMFTIMI